MLAMPTTVELQNTYEQPLTTRTPAGARTGENLVVLFGDGTPPGPRGFVVFHAHPFPRRNESYSAETRMDLKSIEDVPGFIDGMWGGG